MTKIAFTLFIFFSLSASAQDAKALYEKGLELAKQGDADSAIKYFDQSIALKDDEFVAWYNRGITKLMIHHYEDALTDFDQTLKLAPGYKKAYLNRGSAKKHLTDYEGALEDLNFAIKLDTIYGEAYYNRGLLYNMTGKRIPACLDFERALSLGIKNAQSKMERCKQYPTADTSIHPILYLKRAADNDKYGFSADHPIMLGNGPEGGPANERTYLELLRDVNGKPLKYERLGSCCAYKSAHAFFGDKALLDEYQITYTVANGTEKKATVYISMYDYEEPMILYGFKTVAAH